MLNTVELNEIRLAVDQTHSATTSQSRRNELYQYLECKTRELWRCKEMGYHFINKSEDHYRLFGYHCIRKVANKWPHLEKKDKGDLKKLCINLFKFKLPSNQTQSNTALLKEKIAELIVITATNAWPSEWNDLFNELFQISQQNPMSLEILFIILKDLYFVCGDRQIIPEKRKKRIKDELMKNHQQIIQIFNVTLNQCFQQVFINNNYQNNMNNNNNYKLATDILRRCLEAMPKYLNQFPLKSILNSQILIGLAKILQFVAKTSNDTSNVPLSFDGFYRFALFSSIYFFMRKFSELNTSETKEKINQERVILTVWNIEMETAKHLYMMTHNNSNNNNASDNNVALQRLDNMLESMVKKLKLFNKMLNSDLKDKGNNQLANSIRDIFLGLSNLTMNSSDLNIRLRSMTIWTFVLEESNLLELIGYDSTKPNHAQNEKFTNVVIGIMKYVLNHFRVKFHDLKSFETEEEWQTQRNNLKSRISRLLQQCFVLCPVKGMECIGQYTVSILNSDKDLVNVNSIGHSTIENQRYIALDGLCDVYRIIFGNSIKYKFSQHGRTRGKKFALHNQQIDESVYFNADSPLLKMTQQLHNILLNWSGHDNDTQLMSRIYPLLSSLIPLYCRQPKSLQVTFERLLSDFPKLLPLYPNAKDSFDIKCNAVACKRRIAFSLLHIAKRIPHICVMYMDHIWKQVMAIIHANFSTFKSINTSPSKTQQQQQQQQPQHSYPKGVIMASVMDLSEGPICHLFELLVCISNGLNDTNKRMKVLSDLLKDVVDNFNSSEIQNVINDSKQFAKMIQFPMAPNLQAIENAAKNHSEYVDERIRFAYHIRTILNILQSTLTASLLSEGQTGLRDLFHTANLDGMPNYDGSKNGEKNGFHDSSIKRLKEIPSWPLFSAVFQNVLKLNKLLSFMYTSDFKSLLSSNYYPIIIALDVKSLYNLQGLKHDELLRNPTAKPKEIIPLEKAVIWIQNVRDYVSRIIAVASYYDGQFFGNPQAMKMIIESMTSYWNELPLSHLAIILKHFFMNFVQLCSPNYYENLIEFFYQFLSVCFKKLNGCWQQYITDFVQNNQEQVKFNNVTNRDINLNKNKLRKENSSYLRNEVYHEFALRDASQKLWLAIAMITINHKERGFILLHDDKISKRFRKTQQKLAPRKKANNFNDDFSRLVNKYGDSNIKEESVDDNDNNNNVPSITLKQDKLVMIILGNENLCKCLLSGIQSSLNWLDNSCHLRISQVAAKFISFIAKHEMAHLYRECGQIFQCALNALSRNVVGDSQANAELNILCVTICQLLGPLCSNIIIDVLKGIPNVHIDDAKSLCSIITSEAGRHPNATYRQSIKAFTNKYVIGKQNILSTK